MIYLLIIIVFFFYSISQIYSYYLFLIYSMIIIFSYSLLIMNLFLLVMSCCLLVMCSYWCAKNRTGSLCYLIICSTLCYPRNMCCLISLIVSTLILFRLSYRYLLCRFYSFCLISYSNNCLYNFILWLSMCMVCFSYIPSIASSLRLCSF